MPATPYPCRIPPDDPLAEKLRTGKRVLVPAEGGSMGPKFESVEYFLVRRLDRRFPMPGTILLFYYSEMGWVMHRLIFWAYVKGLWRYYMKGDGNALPDFSLQACDLMGEALAYQIDGKEVVLTGFGPRLRGLGIAARAALPTGMTMMKRMRSRRAIIREKGSAK